jgi:CHAT domain-containing protein/Tfp pilus assembly protein PilF
MWNRSPLPSTHVIKSATVSPPSCPANLRLTVLFALLLVASVSTVGQTQRVATGPISCVDPNLKPGLIVESIAKNSEGEKAGLAEGDVILSWSRGELKGVVESPFDLAEVEMEQEPLGRVALEGTRGESKREWVIGPDKWGIQTRPNFTGDLLAAYLQGRELTQTDKLDEAPARWRETANGQGLQSCSWLPTWLLFHAAQTFADKKRWEQADVTYQEAIERVPPSEIRTKIQILLSWADSFLVRGDGDNARSRYQTTLDEAQKLGHESGADGRCLYGLGRAAAFRGDLDRAQDYFRESLVVRERLAPESLDVARSLNALGNVEDERKNLAKSEEYHLRALALQKKLSPNGIDVAMNLNGLGIVALDRSDLFGAESYFSQAVSIYEVVAPDSRNLAAILNNLGDVAFNRGELDKAEDFFKRTLAILEKLEPGSADIAELLNNVGEAAHMRGDLGEAELYFERAFALDAARAPESLDMAEIVNNLGAVARERGDLNKAQEDYKQALKIRQNLAPGSRIAAESMFGLAKTLQDQHEVKEAAELYAQTIDILEQQLQRLGGSNDTRAGFRAQYADYYSVYTDLLAAQNQPERAFEVSERSRAIALLEALTDGHVDIHRGAEPSLLEKERRLRVALSASVARKINLVQAPHTDEQLAAINEEVSECLGQYQELEVLIRASSPNYAALTQPQPLGAKEIQQQLLDSDTVLLEYSLGEKRSFVFLVTPDTIQAYELPKGSEIEEAARQVIDLLTTRNGWLKGETSVQRHARLAKQDAEYQKASVTLSKMVLGPVASQLSGKRLLIVADGALHYIPFGALPSPVRHESKAGLPLIAEHEIVNLPSASVLAVLRQQEAARGPRQTAKEVAILADPVFDKTDPRVNKTPKSAVTAAKRIGNESSDSAEHLSRSMRDVNLGTPDSGVALSRLAFSRREAKAIKALVKPESVLESLDFQASRETAQSSELSQYRVVHFATHGLLDNEHPELSGLVLSLFDAEGKPQNGFMNLEDVYNLNVPADLVVLSACQTGLGKEVKAEGLIGLTRGFLYAGASRVVASLWKVDDVATSELMAAFYRGMLQEGETPSGALRQAQLEIQKHKNWANPYYWAAFTLQGEWR